MTGSSVFTILFLTCLVMLPAAESLAQTESSRFGPVVNAWLAGLEEELNELDYQLAHQEISRADYDRAKQRLTIVRRFVEARALGNKEDLVPEFQVLADDELSTLGLRSRPDPNSLAQGEVLDNQWRLISIERGKPRFFVFEHLSRPGSGKGFGLANEAQERRRIAASDVIETIIVPEEPVITAKPRRSETGPGRASATSAEGVETPPVSPSPPDRKAPQIIFIYLPQYSDQARNSGLQGDVIVGADFKADGTIRDVRLEKGLDSTLDQRSIESVKRMGFLPAQRNGRDIDTSVRIIFTFSQEKVSFHLRSPDQGAVN